jgi:hypothetical protein
MRRGHRDTRAERGILRLELLILTLEALDLLLDSQVLDLALERLAGKRARELALGRVYHPPDQGRLPRIGLQLEVLGEMVDGKDRIPKVVQVYQACV